MATLRTIKGNKYARIRWWVGHGYAEKTISLQTKDDAVADHRMEEVQKKEHLIKQGVEFEFEWVNDDGKTKQIIYTLIEAVEEYLQYLARYGRKENTIRSRRESCNSFMKCVGKTFPVQRLDINCINKFIDEKKGELTDNGINMKLGHVRALLNHLHFDKEVLNKPIKVKKIKTNLYSLIIFSDNLFFIEPELIKNIKRITSAKIILFSNISPHNLLPDIEKACVPDYDIIFISDSGHRIEWKELGAKKIVNLPISAACPETFDNILYKSDLQKIYEVTFVGRLDNLHHHRLETLNYLVSQGVQLNIWTWDLSKEYLLKFPLLESALRGDAYGKEMVRVFAQSKIVLNIHILSQPLGGNLRLFEIPATKSLQIADKCPQNWFKDGDEIVLYKNKEDLLRKINYFIDNDEERERIAKNGHEKLVSEHQYKHRVKKIFEILSIIG